jgi:hypothetical protein
MAIKTANKALNIRVGRVSGNTDSFVFGLNTKVQHEFFIFF